MLMKFFDNYATAYAPYKGDAWCYEDGLLYRGLELLHRATGDPRWLAHLTRLITPQILDGPALVRYDQSDYNIDNIMAGRALLYLHEVTGKAHYLETAGLLISQLDTHPRTRSGVYWHKLRYPWQVWLDGLYMGPPFQVGYALRTGNDAMAEDALTQVSKALDMTFVPQTGLYAHAMDEARKQAWADPVTGHTRAHWARAVGWLAMALVDLADLVGPDRFAPLRERAEALFARIAELRQDSGLWLQVIDQPDLDGNYEETSASAMFVYALLRAKALGLWSGTTENLFDAMASQSMKSKPGGGLEMTSICHVAGLGMYENRFRDGTAAYYVSEALMPDDIKGVGPLMMAAATQYAQKPEMAPAHVGQ